MLISDLQRGGFDLYLAFPIVVVGSTLLRSSSTANRLHCGHSVFCIEFAAKELERWRRLAVLLEWVEETYVLVGPVYIGVRARVGGMLHL